MKLSRFLQQIAGLSNLPDWITGTNQESESLPAKIENWPENWQEAYEERAAIMEYEGGLDRPIAEQKAEAIIRNTFFPMHPLEAV